jgi:pimeloyl-ACP methyl ester carboxylesterase
VKSTFNTTLRGAGARIKCKMGAVNTKERLENAERKLVEWGIEWQKSHALKQYDWAFATDNDSAIEVKVEIKDVVIDVPSSSSPQHIHTLRYFHDKTVSTKTPLVCIHGYAQSGSQYYATAPLLSSSYEGEVYAIDKIGCNLSTRDKWEGNFGENANLETSEAYFVDSLEGWRKARNIDKMTLVAHSMGGYVSCRYAEKFPQHIDKLVLVSPVGVPEKVSIR